MSDRRPDDPPVDRATPPWWQPDGLTWCMWALAGWCGVAGWIGIDTRVTDSDPAGNGIGTGMVQGLAALLLGSTGIVAALYLLIRWRPLRYVCIALLAMLATASLVFVD